MVGSADVTELLMPRSVIYLGAPVGSRSLIGRPSDRCVAENTEPVRLIRTGPASGLSKLRVRLVTTKGNPFISGTSRRSEDHPAQILRLPRQQRSARHRCRRGPCVETE